MLLVRPSSQMQRSDPAPGHNPGASASSKSREGGSFAARFATPPSPVIWYMVWAAEEPSIQAGRQTPAGDSPACGAWRRPGIGCGTWSVVSRLASERRVDSNSPQESVRGQAPVIAGVCRRTPEAPPAWAAAPLTSRQASLALCLAGAMSVSNSACILRVPPVDPRTFARAGLHTGARWWPCESGARGLTGAGEARLTSAGGMRLDSQLWVAFSVIYTCRPSLTAVIVVVVAHRFT